MTMLKDLKYEDITYQKGIIKNCNVIITGKKCYDLSIDSDIKRHGKIRKAIQKQKQFTKSNSANQIRWAIKKICAIQFLLMNLCLC